MSPRSERSRPAEGTELALSHDGKRLLYTRSDSKSGPDRTIVLYDFTTGRSQELVHGGVRQAFWSPDDIAGGLPELSGAESGSCGHSRRDRQTKPRLFTLTALPVCMAGSTRTRYWPATCKLPYWISDDDRPVQTAALKDIYGEAFDVAGSDTFRVNPINPDLLLVSAPYLKAPAGAPTDSMGLAAGFFMYEVRSKRRVVLKSGRPMGASRGVVS